MPAGSPSFHELLTQAVNEFAERGYDDQDRVQHWLMILRNAAERDLGPERKIDADVRERMTKLFERATSIRDVQRYVQDVQPWTIQIVKPKLRSELDRRIITAVNLIKINRKVAVENTLRRVEGWSTSIPPGGDDTIDKRQVKTSIGKSLAQHKYEVRRLDTDQSFKLLSNVRDVIATDAGAIACIWYDHGEHDKAYNARKEHMARNGKTYLIRDSWAHKQGLVKPGPAGYFDQITKPGEEVYCFPGDSKVPLAGLVNKGYRRWYNGEMTEIVMSSGKVLRATPNHPVFTTSGWKAVHQIKFGDQLVEITQKTGQLFENNAYDRIPTIAEIFGALNEVGMSQLTPVHSTDFHGDVTNNEVDIVFVDRPLLVDNLTCGPESFGHFRFADPAQFTTRVSAVQKGLMGIDRAPASSARCLRDIVSATGSDPSHPDKVGFGNTARLNIDPFRYSAPMNAEALLKTEKAFSIKISFPSVVNVKRYSHAGHVYNLETDSGYYTIDGLIVHNCRCWVVYITSPRRLPDEMITKTGQAWIERGRIAAQNRISGS